MEILCERLFIEVSQWQVTKDPKALPGHSIDSYARLPDSLSPK
jgi:hypothetical protein